MGACPVMCLAPWSSLPRAAYVLTGRNTGKQLAASDLWYPSRTASKCQFLLPWPAPSLPDVCSWGKIQATFRQAHTHFSFILCSEAIHVPLATHYILENTHPCQHWSAFKSSSYSMLNMNWYSLTGVRLHTGAVMLWRWTFCWYGSYEFPNWNHGHTWTWKHEEYRPLKHQKMWCATTQQL